MSNLEQQSYSNNDLIFDIPFTVEEVKTVLRMMKRSPDDLVVEHFREGGDAVVVWLVKIFNEIVSLEALPSSQKSGIIIPVYKGNEKDPLLPNSYRGIMLSSVVSKC